MKTYSKDLYVYTDLYKKGFISQKMFEDIIQNYIISYFESSFNAYIRKNIRALKEDSAYV